MRRAFGQSLLEYVILIALAAGALAAMVPYVNRAFRSNLREIQENFDPDPTEEETFEPPVIPLEF